jgi:hypothetical protein
MAGAAGTPRASATPGSRDPPRDAGSGRPRRGGRGSGGEGAARTGEANAGQPLDLGSLCHRRRAGRVSAPARGFSPVCLGDRARLTSRRPSGMDRRRSRAVDPASDSALRELRIWAGHRWPAPSRARSSALTGVEAWRYWIGSQDPVDEEPHAPIPGYPPPLVTVRPRPGRPAGSRRPSSRGRLRASDPAPRRGHGAPPSAARTCPA